MRISRAMAAKTGQSAWLIAKASRAAALRTAETSGQSSRAEAQGSTAGAGALVVIGGAAVLEGISTKLPSSWS